MEADEARELGTKLAAALATLPNGGSAPPWLTNFLKLAETATPWIAFVTTAGMLIGGRVMASKMLAQQAAEAARAAEVERERAAAETEAGGVVVGSIGTPQPEFAHG